jgi:phosphatidylserine decarboxylase
MRIAREGYPFVLITGLLSVIALTVSWKWGGLLLGMLALAFVGFFRDPERTPPMEEGLIVSPADGRVVRVSTLPNAGLSGQGSETRVSIFLSPLDVHINRTPIESKVEGVRYQPGKFLAAYKEEASQRNERNALSLVDPRGRKLGVVQVAGVMARRIVCYVKEGDSLSRGQRLGLIMFGSRTDLILPSESRVEVVEGQRVKGGETIIGRFL